MKKIGLLLCLFAASLAMAKPARSDVTRSDTPLPGVTRELGYFDGADGNRLAYVLYRPAKLQRYPTIAWFDVYGAGSLPPVGMVRAWIERGYAFVSASVRGTGCSPGDYQPFNQLPDARDGAAFVDWAGSQDWSSGKVGLTGSSQPGILLFGIAAQRPRHLAAIAPGGTISRLYADGWYLGGIYNASFAAHWSEFDQPAASRAGADLRVHLGDTACAETAQRIGPNSLVRLLAAHPYDGPYYQQAAPYDLALSVGVPTLMVQSWTDPAVGSSAIWVFARVAARDKRLFVLNGSHEAYLYSTAQEEVHRWMDRWVKNERNGIERLPRVRVDFETRTTGAAGYGDIVAATPGWSIALRDWPAPDTRWDRLYLTADGHLDAARPDAIGERRYFYPAGTELPGDAAQFALHPLDWGSLAYRSAAMREDTAILGSVQLRLYAASQQTNTDFMVLLHDVSPSGDVTYLQRAYLRASRRAVDSAQSNAQMVFHPQFADEPLQAGQTTEFQISFWPVAHLLRAGHALELLITAPSPHPAPGWGLLPLMLPGFNTVFHGGVAASELRIPVIPGLRAQATAPACGDLPFQPCRKATP
jgi:putative CocE/NonD family hydrolase